ncbi:MAG TPA: peptidylprolyl isomerase [Saprospiraceae bacterium]|jgi:cyclophilin family peptidyl-prolyl cis-trans isomerase/HEAT repeat protein|nr:peptidylprolyl isomerase [Saprospiraceae bacterium]HRO07571.1 peptidylprolyl isomerase [Saprospiraceae bacterium]HRP40854.1 peptidylprolyl isomerase [Saprospiraceae bacterium]
MIWRFIAVISITILLVQSCVPVTKSTDEKIVISYSDSEVQHILDLQDKQDIPGLLTYFKSENPSYRYLAVNAFGSIKSAETADSLLRMLQDPVLQVRATAAWAIGQCGNSKLVDRLILSFRGKDSFNVNNIFNANILESVGRLGALSDLKKIATVKTYRSTDTLLLLGQARAIYRMALRDIVCDEGTSRMVDLLTNNQISDEVQLIAAHYLSRAKNINLEPYTIRMSDIYSRERIKDIKLPLALALGNSKDSTVLPLIKKALRDETDFSIKINLIRSLNNFPYLSIKDAILSELKNTNTFVAAEAAQVILKKGITEDVPLYASYDTITIPWEVRAPMNGAVLAHSALYFTKFKSAFSERILRNIKEATSPYTKAAYIAALSKDPYNYQLVGLQYKNASEQIVKTAALDGMGDIIKNPFFFKAFGNNYGKVKAEILGYLVSAINSGDVGQIATAANLLQDPKLGWKEWIKDLDFMNTALTKLQLPQDIEIYNALNACIAYFEGKKYTPKIPDYNTPIDWSLLSTMTDSSSVAVKTTQGIIRIQLLRKIAPGTVANFLNLVNKKYYTGKVFHRIVPNFVVQTGCSRGDGYGSEPFSIRSELPQIYYDKGGYVGMASAGNHTESTQWFITETATPHLDGNYTIFGKLTEGMDVVEKLTQEDKINDIIFVK